MSRVAFEPPLCSPRRASALRLDMRCPTRMRGLLHCAAQFVARRGPRTQARPPQGRDGHTAVSTSARRSHRRSGTCCCVPARHYASTGRRVAVRLYPRQVWRHDLARGTVRQSWQEGAGQMEPNGAGRAELAEKEGGRNTHTHVVSERERE
eukprot:5982296-Pleurochrysis_carterae.AAC.2